MDTNTAVSDAITSPLRVAIAAFDAEQGFIRQEYEQRAADLAHRRTLVEEALGASPAPAGNGSSNGHNNGKPAEIDPMTLSVSPEREEAVHKYLRKHRRARQSSIAKSLDFNSGSVSNALRRLEAEGLVERSAEKVDGSYEWTVVRKKAAAA
jgi:hypothetical protein